MKVMLVLVVLTACSTDTFTDGDGGDSAAACPNENGKYLATFSGAGCKAGPQDVCIAQTGCSIDITDVAGSFGAMAQIDEAGAFTGAVQEGLGTVNLRTGCTGVWSAGSTTMTIECGGQDASQSCTATLSQSATTCN